MPDVKEPAKSGTTEQPENDVFRVVLHARDPASLAQLLQQRQLDAGPVQARLDARESEVQLFVNEGQIAELKKDGWKLEVYENLSEVGRSRQQEVGKGDRFDGGKITPQGLGKKIGEDG